MKSYKYGAGTIRRWPKVALFLVVAAVLLVVAGVIGVRSIYINNLRPLHSESTEDIIFVIDSGDTVEKISGSLEEKKIIRSSWAFTQYVRTKELSQAFKAGTYRLKASQDVPAIVTILTEGSVAIDLFTILPGKRIEQIRQAFIEEGFDEVAVDAALNPNLYDGHPALVDKPNGVSLEGYLYPDSYQKIAETTPQTIIRQSLDEMAEALSPNIRAGIAAQGLGVYQGIILASIVEKEVSGVNPETRPQVAQVFLKRLNIGMMLQSNATDVLPAEYDTYSIPALPPGPISNTTISSLQAVANPAKTDFLFFVAGKDCVTRFSNTVEQHEQLKTQFGVARVEDKCV
jgi:UPF0755 protein